MSSFKRIPYLSEFIGKAGVGLPAAKAMACGCIVIGYHGNGGMKFFDSSYCFPIREGNIKEFVKNIETILTQSNQDSETLKQMRLKASKAILERYSREKAENSIVQAFQELLKVI